MLSPFIDTIHLGTIWHMLNGFIMWAVIATVLSFIFSIGLHVWQRDDKLWLGYLAITSHLLIFLFALYLDMISFMIRMFSGMFSGREEYFSSVGSGGRLFIADVFWTVIGLLISLGIYMYLLKRTKHNSV